MIIKGIKFVMKHPVAAPLALEPCARPRGGEKEAAGAKDRKGPAKEGRSAASPSAAVAIGRGGRGALVWSGLGQSGRGCRVGAGARFPVISTWPAGRARGGPLPADPGCFMSPIKMARLTSALAARSHPRLWECARDHSMCSRVHNALHTG